MPLWTWFLRLISGFLPISGEKIGKIIWVLVWVILALTVYHKIFEPKSITQIERIETQVNNACPAEDSIAGIKINLWKLNLKLGI